MVSFILLFYLTPLGQRNGGCPGWVAWKKKILILPDKTNCAFSENCMTWILSPYLNYLKLFEAIVHLSVRFPSERKKHLLLIFQLFYYSVVSIVKRCFAFLNKMVVINYQIVIPYGLSVNCWLIFLVILFPTGGQVKSWCPVPGRDAKQITTHIKPE